MSDLVVAIGLVLAIEGTLYAVAPGHLKTMARALTETPEGILRIAGVAALAMGVTLVWIVRG
jgi:uncharacterized protein YjeT (DUF2065 family)